MLDYADGKVLIDRASETLNRTSETFEILMDIQGGVVNAIECRVIAGRIIRPKGVVESLEQHAESTLQPMCEKAGVQLKMQPCAAYTIEV